MASDNDRAAIRKAYKDYLGRDASEAEIDAYLANSIDVAADIRDIAGSNEAQDYAARNAQSGSENDRPAIRQAYLDYLGRPASEDEIDAYLANSIDVAADIKDIAGSDEAQNHAGSSTQAGTMANIVNASNVQQESAPYDGYDGGLTGDPGPEENTDADTDVDGEPNTQEIADATAAYKNATSAIQSAYQKHLGRAATNEDITGWWSGKYGWGDAQTGLDGWLRGIETEGNRLKGLTGATTPENTNTAPKQAPGGYDQTKWESGHGSVKYDAGRFLAGLTKPSEIKAMVESAAFQARFPGATFNDKDKIDFGNNLQDGVPVGVVDVLMSANQAGDTSGGFWWGAGSGDGATDNTGDGVSSPDPGGEIPDTGVGGGGGGGGGGGAVPGTDNPLSAPDLVAPPNPFGMGPGGGGGMMGPGGGGGTMGNMITPYNPLATYSPEAYVPPDPYRPPAYEAPTPFAGDPYRTATPYQQGTYDAAVPFSRDEYEAATPFEAPTAADMAADPSYQFRLKQGQDALERSGAARGVTNTGGTLKDILDYGQNAASQEYGNVYGRKRDTYDANERNRFNAYAANYGNAMNAYGMNEQNRFGAFNANEQNRAGAFNTNEANRFRDYSTNYGNAMNAYGMNEQNRAGAFNTNVRNAGNAYNTNAANRDQAYTTNEIARLNENQTAENRRAGAYNTNLGAYQNQQRFGLQAQGQGFDQSFRNWQQQYNQQRMNQNDRFNQMYQLGGAQ